MPASADPHPPGRAPRGAVAAGQGGFTLLEIMVTVAILGLAILPMLHVREKAANRAYRTTHLMRGLHHAEELVARYGREKDQIPQFEGVVEEEPQFRYLMTFENWDLASGRSEDELEEDAEDEDSGIIRPPDAGTVEEDPRGDPHKVRRYRIEVFWPNIEEEDAEESVVLEGFLPRIWEEPVASLGDSNNSSSTSGTNR